MKVSLLTNGAGGQGKALPPSHSRFFLPLLFSSISPSLSSLWVVMEMKAQGGGTSIIEAVVGLVVGWELGIVKWSNSCTHKQRVRWSRREVEGLGVRERETRKRRIERGPEAEQREEPTPRVLALLLTDSTF